MRTTFPKPSIALLVLAFAICAQNASGQNSQSQPPPQPANASQPSTEQQPHHGSPGGEVGRGAGDIGKGTARGAGAAAKGVGKGAGDLVHCTHSTPLAMSAKAESSLARTWASAPPKALAKSPRAQVGV